MKNEIKEITEIITRLQDCGRKRISRTEGVIVNNEDIATALHKAGYRKQEDTVKEFAEKAINSLNKYCYITRQVSFDAGFIEGIKQAQATLMDLAEQYGKEE